MVVVLVEVGKRGERVVQRGVDAGGCDLQSRPQHGRRRRPRAEAPRDQQDVHLFIVHRSDVGESRNGYGAAVPDDQHGDGADGDDELIPLTDEEARLVAGELAYRAGLLLKLYNAGLIREPATDEEAVLVAEVSQLFDR